MRQSLAVCQILPVMDEGGMERGTVDIARAVVEAGGRALVISAEGRLVPDLLRAGGHHMDLRTEPLKAPMRHWRAFQVGGMLKQQKFTILHTRTPATTLLGLMAARRTGARVVATAHGLEDLDGNTDQKAIAALRQADRVIAVSDYVAETLSRTHGVPADRIVTISPGINLARYNPAAVKADRFIKLAQKWMLPDGVPVIVVPARLVREKGQLALIKALTHLKDLSFFCLLVGDETVDDAYREEVEETITSAGLEGKVRLTGYCTDMPAAYMLADVVVSPNVTPEAFGRITAEALAMGRPVVASTVGGSAELVTPGETGWLASPEDSAALSIAIRQALQFAPAAREKLAMAARALVARDYSLDRMCNETLDLYRSLDAANTATGTEHRTA
ncbi:MAG: glycosyltransferase family 4 protein [Sphingomonadales bacterium]